MSESGPRQLSFADQEAANRFQALPADQQENVLLPEQTANMNQFAETLQGVVSVKAKELGKGYSDAIVDKTYAEHPLDGPQVRGAVSEYARSDEYAAVMDASSRVRQLETEQNKPLLTSDEREQVKKDLKVARGAETKARNQLQPRTDTLRGQFEDTATEQISDSFDPIDFWTLPKKEDKADSSARNIAPAAPMDSNPGNNPKPASAEAGNPAPAEPTAAEPTPSDKGEKKNNSGISDEELAALGNNDEFEGLSSEELRTLGVQAREEALTKFKRARMNKAAVNRLAKKLGLSEEEVATLQARMNEPVTENDVRPPARSAGDTDKLKPENIGSMDKSELNKYLNLELNRNRFNNYDAETARNKAEQVLRKLAEQQGWTDEKLENQLKVLNEYVASEPKDTSEQPHPGYAGPVPKGMEVEYVEPDQVQRKRLRERLSDRWANARTRSSAAVRGDMKTALGPIERGEKDPLTRKQKIALGIGATATVLAVLIATKRIDLNPFDNDISSTIDLNPFNNDNNQVPQYALGEDAKGDVVPKVRGEQTSYDVFRKAGVDHPTLNHIFDNPDDFLRQSEWIQAEIAKGRDPKEVEEQLLNFYDSVKK